MMTAPHKFIPYGSPGTGSYGKSMGTQNTYLIDVVKDKILKTVESIPVREEDGGQLFTIGDYGTSDGCVSIPLLRDIIKLVRRKHGEIPIQIVYEDQPSNDFNSLIKRVHGLIPDPPTYLRDFRQVFVMSSGINFYDQVVPSNTADLIMSFNAIQYLSELPTTYRNSLHRFPDATEEERKLATSQAAKDWESFLLLRAKELKSGGVMIVSMACDDPNMKFDGYRHCTPDIEEGLLNMWRRFRDEGKITEEEFINTNFNRCTRVEEEYRSPFEDINSDVYKAGLRLVNAEQILVPCLTRRQWQETLDKEGVDDRATWAADIVKQHRCWTNNSFIRGLSSTRSDSEKEALVDEMYSRLEKEILAQDPREYKNDVLMGYVFARKI